jgi:DNA-directed RNA polymerase specialized sigma24 family protein
MKSTDPQQTEQLLTMAAYVPRNLYDPTGLHSQEDLQQIALLAGWEAVLEGAEGTSLVRTMREAVRTLTRARMRELVRRSAVDVDGPTSPIGARDPEPVDDLLGQSMRQLPDLEYQLIAGIMMGLHPITVGLRMGMKMEQISVLLKLARQRLSGLMERGQAA